MPGKCGPPASHRPPVSVLGCANCLAAVGSGVPGAVLKGQGPGVRKVSGSRARRASHHNLVPLYGRRNCQKSPSPGLRGSGAPACVRGHSLGGVFSSECLDMRAAGNRGGRVALCAPRRNSPGCRLSGALRLGTAWRSWVLGAARGVSSQRVSLCGRARPRTAVRWRAPRPAIPHP